MGRNYRTMKGVEVDMDALLEKNQLMPAVGNAKMNARGDELGPGGKIVKRREDTINAYYENNPNAHITPTTTPSIPSTVKPPVDDTTPVFTKGKK
jgi:hypothetical protein